MEPAVIVEGNQTVVDQRGQPFVFGGSDGARFPLARIELETAGVQFHTKRSAILRAVRAADGLSQKQCAQKGSNYRKQA